MKAAGDSTPTDSGNNSSSEGENTSWQANRSDSEKIGMALKRSGSVSRASNVHDSARAHRRRSPTAASMAGSPPNENNLFTASHARRMVKSEKESAFHSSVLSPRTAPVMKSNRRTTIGEGRQVSGSMASSAVRLTGTIGSTPKARESVTGVMGKGGWR